jgi:hypothetical protein
MKDLSEKLEFASQSSIVKRCKAQLAMLYCNFNGNVEQM